MEIPWYALINAIGVVIGILLGIAAFTRRSKHDREAEIKRHVARATQLQRIESKLEMNETFHQDLEDQVDRIEQQVSNHIPTALSAISVRVLAVESNQTRLFNRLEEHERHINQIISKEN